MKEKMIQLPISEVKGIMSVISILTSSYEFENIETHKQVSKYLTNLNQLIQKEEEN